jgi:hypothetical protein
VKDEETAPTAAAAYCHLHDEDVQVGADTGLEHRNGWTFLVIYVEGNFGAVERVGAHGRLVVEGVVDEVGG